MNFEQIAKKYIQLSSLIDFKVSNFMNKLDGKKEKARVYFRIVPESEISEKYLLRAERILRVANWTLKLKGIKISWIEYSGCGEKKDFHGKEFIEHDGVAKGFYDIEDNKIFIRHDIPFKDIGFTLAHELHHAWFQKEYGDQYRYEKDRDVWESSANSFAHKIMMQIWDLDHYEKPLPFFPAGKTGYHN